MIAPFLKWAGGKRQLLPHIRKLYPESINTYYEPFLGGGAVFFDLLPDKYLISDSNPELINTYKCIATKTSQVIALLKKMKNTEEFYYEIRKLKFHNLSKIDAAARTIFLNRTCFNGLYRVNKNGDFNVPFGRYKNPDIIQSKSLINASKILKYRKIKCMDFRKIQEFDLSKKDLIFFDPPYVPLEGYSDFKRYTKEQFHADSQENLATIFKNLSKKKIRLILTNSNTELVHRLFKGFDKIIVKSSRRINCIPSKRKGEEIIIHANL